MSSCCQDPNLPPAETSACPSCGTPGKTVDLQTVKSLLVDSALRHLNIEGHRFCQEPTCQVVYFDRSGQRYDRTDVRVRVWQKEPFGDRPICYCFSENETDIRQEVLRTGESHAVERVRAHIAAGRCACEIRNPKGTCCLGDVAIAVKRLKSAPGTVPDVESFDKELVS